MVRLSRREMLRWLGLAGVAAVAAGCTPTPTPTPVPAPTKAAATAAPTAVPATATPVPPTKAPEPVTVTFWHTQQDDSFRGKLLKDMADRFHAKNPTITVNPVFVGTYDDLYKKSMAAISAGNPPDMGTAYESYIAEFMKANVVIPLEPLIEDKGIGLTAADKDDIFPGYWSTNLFPEFGNKMLSFPFTKSALGMYYNLTLLKGAGLSAAPKTWDEFETVCKAVTKDAVKGLAFYEDCSTFNAFLYSRGATELTDDQTKAIFNSQQGIDSLDLLVRLQKAGAAYKPEGNYADQADFGKGVVAFNFASTSGTSYYADAIKKSNQSFEWGCTVPPQKDPTKPRTVMYGANVCIFKSNDARQRAAWQYVKWFTDTDQTAEWGSVSGYTPIRKTAMKKLQDSGYMDKNPVVKEVYNVIAPNSYPEPNVRGQQEIRDIVKNAWVSVTTGVSTPKAALDDAVVKANEALASKK
jgi:ABC-type glycerol-3-phosphate transport system substrate-binding protein